jgi:signal transduction histidine kinase
VIGHVVRNGQDAVPSDGVVTVRVARDGDEAVIEVADDGAGMDEHFVRERLFKPFDTTKGNKGMGIGAYQTREFVRAAGGDVHVHSRLGEGTRFVIRLPLAEARAPAGAVGSGAIS